MSVGARKVCMSACYYKVHFPPLFACFRAVPQKILMKVCRVSLKREWKKSCSRAATKDCCWEAAKYFSTCVPQMVPTSGHGPLVVQFYCSLLLTTFFIRCMFQLIRSHFTLFVVEPLASYDNPVICTIWARAALVTRCPFVRSWSLKVATLNRWCVFSCVGPGPRDPTGVMDSEPESLKG